MISMGLHEDLHNFLADLWNASVPTGGNSRFSHPLSCWLSNCKYEELADYMKEEYDRGRVLLYPLFPENHIGWNKCEDMSYDRIKAMAQRKPKQATKKRCWWRIWELI